MGLLLPFMDRGHWLRRFIHMLAPLFLVYYAIPNPIWEGGPSKELLLICALIIVLVFEAYRLTFKPKILGIRSYEYQRVSAATWAALGMTSTFLFFPLEYAAPVVIGMGWIDPLCGELRRVESRLYPALPLAVYFIIALLTMTYLIGFNIQVVLASIVATILAIAIEKPRLKYLDDDFLMLVVPILGIWVVFELLPI
jgi:hypothetical protein